MQAKVALNIQIRTTPALILAGELLRLPSDAVDEMITREVFDNPALEAREKQATSYLRTSIPSAAPQFMEQRPSDTSDWGETDDDVEMVDRVPACETPIDQLIAQLRLVATGNDFDVAVYLLHSLDKHGFLKVELDTIANELCTSRAN